MKHYFSKSKKGKKSKIIRRTKKIQKGGSFLKNMFKSDRDVCKQLNPKKTYSGKLIEYIDNITSIYIDLEIIRKRLKNITKEEVRNKLAQQIISFNLTPNTCTQKVKKGNTPERMNYLISLLSNNINIIYNSISKTKNINEQAEMMEYMQRTLRVVLKDNDVVDSKLREKYKLLESIGKTVKQKENKTNSAARTVNKQLGSQVNQANSCVSDMLSKFEGLGLTSSNNSNTHDRELDALMNELSLPNAPTHVCLSHNGGYKNRKRNRKYKKRSRKLGTYV